jgi:hypothetical protein
MLESLTPPPPTPPQKKKTFLPLKTIFFGLSLFEREKRGLVGEENFYA